jgi:beta-ureidopropionase / N-carbamoyl-L-amino-acid hydrolase
MNDLRVNGPRLLDRLAALAEIGAIDGGGSSRLALTDDDRAGRDLVVTWMRDLGLDVTIDAIGNVIARWGDATAAPVMAGSHIDTVRTGGRYDGNLGVLGGLEVIEAVIESGHRPRRPLAVAFFTNEEGARFPPDMMGSLTYVGGMAIEEALDITGIDGTTVGSELRRIGYVGPNPCPGPAPHAYVELHIEQGPVLEAMNKPTGVVVGTFGVERSMIRFTGQAAHSGSTPIPMRRDAFLAAAQTALACREIGLRHSKPGAGVVCTVGVVNVEPKIVTAVPGVCEISLDQRALDAPVLAEMHRDARDVSERFARENNVAVEWKHLWRIDPRPFDATLVRLCEDAVREETGDAPRLPSGPLHDAAEMVPHMPVVMMFACSSNGLSHCKEEDTPEPQLEQTIRAYLRLVGKAIAHVAAA